MKSMKWAIAAVVGTLVLSPLPVLAQKAGQDGYQVGQRLGQTGKAGAGRFREISWDDLIPADWNPEKFFLDLKLDELQDNDPRTTEVMRKIREEWDRAPLVQRFNGERIRIPGFIVPLETDGKTIREFLLVPYFGACVHVPPPPANQLIHVMPDKPVNAKLDMLPVWVNGVLTVARFESDLGNAGYQLRAISVEEYKEPMPK
ncbi:MAG: DUF3299 domain-containing protein [Thiomonas sp.]|jgi:hypothetical protein|nr:DUF3299 domain-containing protein [Azoarcus sp.]MDD2872160.1 DUF3299 domain-containing protein [Azoarcus sp.]MDX9836226.1 DUF3299 domain-containing protein [Azoarcus sp.]